jgi:alpha-L-rhamnosidase
VNCSYESHYGKIVSNWKTEANQLHWEVTIPANSTATVYVQGNNITEGGLPAENALGVNLLKTDEGCTVFRIESGVYNFESSLK